MPVEMVCFRYFLLPIPPSELVLLRPGRVKEVLRQEPHNPFSEVPPLPMVVDALKQVLAELGVKTTNFGRVRRSLAGRLCAVGAALDPWCQQLGDTVQGILQQVDPVVSKSQILRPMAFLSVVALCLRLCLCPSPLRFAAAACQRRRLRLRQPQCLLLCLCLVLCLCLRLSLSAAPVRAPTHDPTSARALKMEVDYIFRGGSSFFRRPPM